MTKNITLVVHLDENRGIRLTNNYGPKSEDVNLGMIYKGDTQAGVVVSRDKLRELREAIDLMLKVDTNDDWEE